MIGYKDPHFWFHTSSKIMGALHIQIAHNVVEQKLISQVSSLLFLALKSVNVYFEKQ